jgi:hypothetical protein
MMSFLQPLNIFIIIIICFVLFTTLGSYKEGFTENSNDININGIEIKNTLFTGKNGNTARILSNNGNYVIIITDKSGKQTKYTFSSKNSDYTVSTSVESYDSPTSTNFIKNTYNKTIFYAPNGSTAEIIKLNGTIVIQIRYSNGNIETFTQDQNYSQPTFYPNQASYSSTYYNQLNNQSMNNQSMNNQSMNNQSMNNNIPTFNNDYDYSSSLPPAIPASQIPLGQEDLYILKSEIVPPVCPAPITACHHKTDKCAPCPPCGRCPEPNFECKKVPSYKPNNMDLPQPMISPYSTFGT